MFERYIDYKSNPNDSKFFELLSYFNPIIKKQMYYVPKEEREDFYQVALMKMYDVLTKYTICLDSNFHVNWKSDEYSNNGYLKEFLEGSYVNKTMFIEALNDVNKREQFDRLFFNFVGKIKLLKYFSKVFYTCRVDFNRKCDEDIILNAVRLNSKDVNEIELIEHIKCEEEIEFEINCTFLNEEERIFIDKYVLYNSQKKMAEYYNITQQAISKKYKQIINRLKKNNDEN